MSEAVSAGHHRFIHLHLIGARDVGVVVRTSTRPRRCRCRESSRPSAGARLEDHAAVAIADRDVQPAASRRGTRSAACGHEVRDRDVEIELAARHFSALNRDRGRLGLQVIDGAIDGLVSSPAAAPDGQVVAELVQQPLHEELPPTNVWRDTPVPQFAEDRRRANVFVDDRHVARLAAACFPCSRCAATPDREPVRGVRQSACLARRAPASAACGRWRKVPMNGCAGPAAAETPTTTS